MRPRHNTLLLITLIITTALAACGMSATPAATIITCTFAGSGTAITLDGERLVFTCPNVGGDNAALVGNVRAGPNGWQIDKKTYKKSGSTYQTTSTSAVTITSILLADATQCDFVGTGATIILNGKRVNFTCPNAGNDSVALVGEIQVVAQGWTIEKDTYTKTASGFVVKSSAQVPIRSIDVAPAQ